jgi:glycosyltransferase involved in cell wall biosynthesis
MNEISAPKVHMSSADVKVLKILSDRQVGGIIKSLDGLLGSSINKDFTFSIQSLSETKSALASSQPDLIVIHDPCNWALLPQLYHMRQHCPVIIADHHYCKGFERLSVKHKERFRLMLRLCYGLANCVVAVSQAQADWMLQHHLVSPEKLRVITQTTPIHQLLSISPRQWQQPRVLAAYGRFNQQKGFDVLLKAMQLLPDGAVKLHVGGYGEDEDMLKRIAQGKRNIKFLGEVRDLPTFLDNCDAVVIPSRWEPWGNVCLEAKAASRPVIVANVDGLSEQVTNCGLLVEPEDPQALAEAIAHFCTLSDDTLSMWGKNGRQNVKNAQQYYNHEWKNLIWAFIDRVDR